MNWVLLIIVMIASGGSDGGQHSATQKIEISSKKMCLEASRQIKSSGYVWPTRRWNNGKYIILTFCVKQR